MDVVLASASPRRLALLIAAGLQVRVEVIAIDETPLPAEQPRDVVLRLASAKARAASPTDTLVVAADTEVVFGGKVLGKPKDARHAVEMLSALSGHAHTVMTGFCARRGATERMGLVETLVQFRRISADEIERYVASGDAHDKAGAYGIQGAGGFLVEQLHGSYTNVVGLPLAEVLIALRDLAATNFVDSIQTIPAEIAASTADTKKS